MFKNLLSKKMYDYLSWHTNEIEKEQEHLFKENYMEETLESMSFEAFFKDYLAHINNYLNTVSVSVGGNDNCPFVIIGSIVDVHDSEYKEDYRYQIVLPYSKQDDTTLDYASCLSPLGKSLLFKSADENVKIQIPSGVLNYTIKKITIPDDTGSKKKKESEIFNSLSSNIVGINI